MSERSDISATASHVTADDWLERLLARDATEHAHTYIGDNGFTARVMRTLPAADALPAWRRLAVGAIWLTAAALFAIVLPGTAFDVARGVVRLFAAQPFSLSTIALAIIAIGVATWTGAAVALRRD